MNNTSDAATFDWSDYSIFISMLMISAIIGIYFGCFGSKQRSTQDYLLAGKSMMALPVGISIVASSVSGITIIGLPTEIYTYNCTYAIIVFALVIAVIFAYYFFIPVFYDMKVNNALKYLELRYDSDIRNVASIFYCLTSLLQMPCVIYVPALTLSQVTGINLYIMSTVVTTVCIFYTMMGGLKAVIWTDFFQTIIIFVTCLTIKTIGTIDVGGISYVISTGYNDGKMNIFNMDPNPFQRNTFWTMMIGKFFTIATYIGTDQGCVQRFLSLSTRQSMRIVMVILTIGFGFLIMFSIYDGLLIYATYYGCDPIHEKIISQADQIFPYFVLDKIGHIPTLPGFFVAGVLSAALSTLSTVLNVTAGAIYDNHIKQRYNREDRAHIIIKLITIIIGIFSISMTFIIEKLGSILAASFIITSITITPVNLLFVLGMMIPFCNKTGAISGMVSCVLFLTWLAIGSSLSKVNLPSKRIYPEGINTCEFASNDNRNMTIINSMDSSPSDDEIFFLYKLSFVLYDAVGIIVGVIVAVIVSYLTGPTDYSKLNPYLISPPLRKFLPKNELKDENTAEKLLELKIIGEIVN